MTRKCDKIAIALISLSRTETTTKMIEEKKQGFSIHFLEIQQKALASVCATARIQANNHHQQERSDPQHCCQQINIFYLKNLGVQ